MPRFRTRASFDLTKSTKAAKSYGLLGVELAASGLWIAPNVLFR